MIVGSSYQESYGNYYGRLLEVLKLYYHNGHDVILFKCHWFDHTTHVKVDRNRITTVDVRSKLNVEDVFVLASQAHQVCYVPNITNGKSPWYTVLKTKSRQVDDNTTYDDNETYKDVAFQNDMSNASSSHVDTVIIDDPSNFFIDLRVYENDIFTEDIAAEQEAEQEAEGNNIGHSGEENFNGNSCQKNMKGHNSDEESSLNNTQLSP